MFSYISLNQYCDCIFHSKYCLFSLLLLLIFGWYYLLSFINFSFYIHHYLFSPFFGLTLLVLYTLLNLESMMSDTVLTSIFSFLLLAISGKVLLLWPLKVRQGHLISSDQSHMSLLMETFKTLCLGKGCSLQ